MGPPRSRFRPLGLPPRIALGFAAAIGAVLAAGLFSSLAFSTTAQSSALAEEATARQLAIEELESALLVGHTALDAYLGTRELGHRDRHDQAAGRISPALERLAALSAGTIGSERNHIETIRTDVARLAREHAAALAFADAGAFDRPLALRRAGAGREALEHAKVEIEELELAGEQ